MLNLTTASTIIISHSSYTVKLYSSHFTKETFVEVHVLLSYIQMYQFQKVDIPEEVIDKKDLMEKLLPFSISISQYESAINMDDITM